MAGAYSARSLATAQPLNGGTDELLVDDAEVVETAEELATDVVLLRLDILLNVELIDLVEVVPELGVVKMEVALASVFTLDVPLSMEGRVPEIRFDLELDIEVDIVRTLDEADTGTERLELDLWLDLEVAKTNEELDIGYRALLELILLLDSEIGPKLVVALSVVLIGVVLTLGLVNIPELIGTKDLVDAEDS
jgi:hypothetical protein